MTRIRQPNEERVPERSNGFTLVELLAVIAILSLLLAILVPSLQAAKASARNTVCQSNLRQLAIAWQMYLNDHQGRFLRGPNANLAYGGWNGAVNWRNRPLNRYVRLGDTVESPQTAAVFACPADEGGVPGTPLPCIDYFGTSYQTNILVIGQDQIGLGPPYLKDLHKAINANLKSIRVSSVVDPGRLLLVGDYGWVNQWMAKSTLRTEWHGRPGCHNLAFLDTHSAFLRIRKGMYITEAYRVLPFGQLDPLARSSQQEEPYP